jgi:hypothetical protein
LVHKKKKTMPKEKEMKGRKEVWSFYMHMARYLVDSEARFVHHAQDLLWGGIWKEMEREVSMGSVLYR